MNWSLSLAKELIKKGVLQKIFEFRCMLIRDMIKRNEIDSSLSVDGGGQICLSQDRLSICGVMM